MDIKYSEDVTIPEYPIKGTDLLSQPEGVYERRGFRTFRYLRIGTVLLWLDTQRNTLGLATNDATDCIAHYRKLDGILELKLKKVQSC